MGCDGSQRLSDELSPARVSGPALDIVLDICHLNFHHASSHANAHNLEHTSGPGTAAFETRRDEMRPKGPDPLHDTIVSTAGARERIKRR